jgi:HAD superfamily phosphoserine phosphatase-like hydrolase
MKIAFCFDLDGTLTKEEILPKIAKQIDLFEEIDLLTNITMKGLITFDRSFKLRVKLLSSIPISKVNSIVDSVSIDSVLQSFVKKNKDNCFIVTGNLDVWTADFVQKNYACGFFSSKGIREGDTLLGLEKILYKEDAIKELRKTYDIIVSIGDGMNDCSMFASADIGVAFGGVHEPVSTLLKMSDYVCYNPNSLVTLLENLKLKYEAKS